MSSALRKAFHSPRLRGWQVNCITKTERMAVNHHQFDPKSNFIYDLIEIPSSTTHNNGLPSSGRNHKNPKHTRFDEPQTPIKQNTNISILTIRWPRRKIAVRQLKVGNYTLLRKKTTECKKPGKFQAQSKTAKKRYFLLCTTNSFCLQLLMGFCPGQEIVCRVCV
jgi:hypothetical protein